ncbi:restriction endonuclease [Geobacillus subterraneus]|uniref:Restriction endonuclease n=2 Tax=Geobacillus TaxID=129337 RepID=A0ABN4NI11_9BACL|nr:MULTISPECIES: restriction endonuclease subunit S [Geobacillus]AMX84323.1 restriction endonuclease [Geobacillus subterraneus]KZS25437.1 restriction endonuclease [Geobacillus subterraneus]OXB90297.1 restriction endonuclease [Geobacillus uzenensis]
MSKTKQKTLEELLEEALVPEDEQPYEVPGNWVWVRLGSISRFIDYRGKTPKKTESGIRLITAKNVRMGYIQDEPKEFISEKDYDSWMTRGIPNVGDILFTTEAPLGNVAQLDINEKIALAQRIITISPYQPLEKTFFKYCLMSPQMQALIKSNATGTTVSGIKASRLKEIEVPLAPLHEQKRIAEKIEWLFAKIDEAKQLIEEVKESFELRWESILDKAFRGELTKKWRSMNSMTEKADDIFKEIQKVYKKSNKKDEDEMNPPYQIPQNWKWVRLGDIVDINPPKKKLADIEDDQICTFIPMHSVSDKTGEIENQEIRKYAEVKKGYTFFLENDILFAKITPCMENGKTAIAQNLINGFGFGSTEFHVIRTNPYINNKLIYYLLRSKKFRMEAKKEMTGAVGQQRVPKSFLENYLFPFPPKGEQDKIVELLDNLYAKEVEINKIEVLEGEIDSIRQSILNKAFRGELGTNDPTDQHAIKLLKEVLKSK